MPNTVERQPNQLVETLKASKTWPPQELKYAARKVSRRMAWRITDRDTLKAVSGFDEKVDKHGKPTRRYYVDPLASQLSTAFADFLFSDPPKFVAANDADQESLNRVIAVNDFAAELHRAERVNASEGEVWWRIHVDNQAEAPLISWVSRQQAIPLFRGTNPVAVAFLTEFKKSDDVVYRHFETHEDGYVYNDLFKGKCDSLGVKVSLDALAETENTVEIWQHNLPMLAGRVVNKLDADVSLGEGIYDEVEDLLFMLNEAVTIGQENTRLTAKKRLFIAGKLTTPEGEFDAGDDVISVSQEDDELGADKTPPVAAVEYSYDAIPLLQHKEDLINTILSRVGLVPQFVGNNIDGQAESGTAIRLRFLPVDLSGEGKGRAWDATIPKLLQLACRVDNLPLSMHGYNRPYADVITPPTFIRGSVLPVDDSETTKNVSLAVTAGVQSQETAIKRLNPEWSDSDVADELARLKAEQALEPTSTVL